MAQRLETLARNLPAHENRVMDWKKKHPLSKKEIQDILYTEKYSKVLNDMFDVMGKNKHIFKHQNIEDVDRKQMRRISAIMSLKMHKLRPVDPKCYLKNDIHQMSMTAHAIYFFDSGFSVKCDITFFLYAKTLYYFSSQNPVQQEMARQAMNYEHIGCFGLTELGHGSNAKGVLTEAIYDHENKQFIMNSPCEDAMKFWIGAAGELATMSVIWAQLVIDGKKYGPHPFIVPIRDPKTHIPYEGVTLGDCGPKNGNDNIDNGYILFKNHRIPKDYGLDRLSGVDENGKFKSIVDNGDKLFGMYMSPLSAGRSFVTINSIATSLNCLAIALRYASQRRQFKTNNNNESEQLLIDYPSMQNRIIPHIASATVYLIGGMNLMRQYDFNVKELLNPKNKMLNELHAITGPCKAKSSWLANKIITDCREVCSGHGYSSYSGLSRMYHGQDVNTTWEGDNFMLLQQTTKYILKTANKLSRGKSFENNSLAFLTQTLDIAEQPSKEQFYDLGYLEKIFQNEIAKLVQECIGVMIEKKSNGVKKIDIWNESQPYFGNTLSLLYGDLYYLEKMMHTINNIQSPSTKELFQNITRLWAFSVIFEQRMFNLEVRKLLQAEITSLTAWLVPRSISLIDCLAAPKEIIGSVFADEKGNLMNEYITTLFTAKDTFQRVPWWETFVGMRDSQE